MSSVNPRILRHTSITRRLDFDAGHRVLGHEGKCAHLHGHRYTVLVTVRAPELDRLGRVIDFSVVKERIGGWIDENWDHNLLLHPDDPQAAHLCKTEKRPPWLMPPGPAANPTAENLAAVLFAECRRLLPAGLAVERVRVYETPNCMADYTADE